MSWLESNCPPYEVDDFIKSMKLQYRNQEIIVDMNWRPKVLFSNLTIIKKQDNIAQTQVEELSKYMQTGKVDEVLKLSGIKRAYLTDVLQPKQPIVVVVDGPPGIGKTTLCRKLLNMWSSETHAREYNLVLYCPLRDSKFAKAEDFPDLFLFDSYKVSKVVEYFKKRNGEGLLIIFDGWDELNTQLRQSSLAAQIIHRKQLYQCSVIVTSRSYASSSLLTASSHHFHVIGFSEEEVSKVIINTFQRDPKLAKALIEKKKEDEKNGRIFAATELDSEHDLEAITQLINDLEVQRLCYVPLVCCAVIKVYEEKSRKLPTTHTELFESIILDTINKYLQIRPRNDLDPNKKISHLSSLPSQLDKPLQELCQIAYTNLVNTRMTFTLYELHQLSLGETFMADNLGLVTSSIEHNNNKYFFIHSSIQEFLAALWIAKYEKEGKDGGEKTEKMFGKHFRDPQFKNCLKFVAGLTGLKHVSYEQYFNKEINLECMRKPRFGLQMDHYFTFYLNCQMRNFVHMESNIFEKLFILFQLVYESCNRNLCQVLAKSIKNQSLCLNNVAFSLYDWSCLKFFLDTSGVKWKHLHLGVLNHRVAVNCHGGIQCKVLEVTLLRPLHCSLPLFCLYSARECYIVLEGGHYNLCYMLESLFHQPKLSTLHITVNHAIVSGITQRTEYLEENIQNSALQEINLEFNGEVGIDIIKSLINGMSRNGTTSSFSLSATSLDDNASFDITCIENLLKNSTIQYLSLNIPDEFLPSSLDIVEVNTRLTGLEMSSKKLVTSILPHITRLCYLILHEPYTPHLIFESNPSLQKLSLSLDAAESAIELFNILQDNTTLQSLRVEMDKVFENTKLFTSLEAMLKQNHTLRSFEMTSEGSSAVYNHIPVSFLSFLHAGITSSTSIEDLSVPIPLSKQQFENVKDLISRNVTLKKCHIDFRPDESYQHSPHERKKEIMISLYEELADVIAMMPATSKCNFRLLGQEIDLKTQNSTTYVDHGELLSEDTQTGLNDGDLQTVRVSEVSEDGTQPGLNDGDLQSVRVSEVSEDTQTGQSVSEDDFKHALEEGTLTYSVSMAFIQGEAQVGKTCLKSLIMSLPYDDVSTSCIEAPVIAFSVDHYGHTDGKGWKLVTDDEMDKKIIAEIQKRALEDTNSTSTESDNNEALLEEESVTNTITHSDAPTVTSEPMDERHKVSEDIFTDNIPETSTQEGHNDQKHNDQYMSAVPVTSQTKQTASSMDSNIFEDCLKEYGIDRFGLHKKWLYFIDSGGQPQYQKLLLAFMPCTTSLILVINLSKNLSAHSSTLMKSSDGKIMLDSRYSLKVEDVLKQVLSAVVSNAQQYRFSMKNSEYITFPDGNLNVISVGTHCDEYEEQKSEGKLETLEEKQKKLVSILSLVEGSCDIMYADDDDEFSVSHFERNPLHEIDGHKAAVDCHYTNAAIEKISKSLKDKSYNIKVPLKWHFFSVLLRKEAESSEGVLMVSSCLTYGIPLKMKDSEVHSALQFFHTLKVLFYYQDSPAKDIVFIKLDSLTDIIKELVMIVCNSRSDKKKPKEDVKKLADRSYLSIKTLESLKSVKKIASVVLKSDDFSSNLLGLFEHLKIAAKLPKGEFLMPALLPVRDVSDPQFLPSTIPLLFYFRTTAVPMGLYCTVIVHLLSDSKGGKWRIISRNECCSNYFTLQRNLTAGFILNVTLVEQLNCIEVYCDRKDERHTVREEIRKAIDEVMKEKLIDYETPEEVFYCPCTQKRDQHVAKVVDEAFIICEDKNDAQEFVDSKKREEYWFWFMNKEKIEEMNDQRMNFQPLNKRKIQCECIITVMCMILFLRMQASMSIN